MDGIPHPGTKVTWTSPFDGTTHLVKVVGPSDSDVRPGVWVKCTEKGCAHKPSFVVSLTSLSR